MSEQSTKFRTENVRSNGGTPARAQHGTDAGPEARKTSSQFASLASLPPLSTRELNRETQCLVLRFPTAQVAEEQGACMRAVESQKNGESGISTVKLINWARRNAVVRAEVARLIGMTGRVTDPEFMQGLTKVLDYIVRQEDAVLAEHDARTACDAAMSDLFGGNI